MGSKIGTVLPESGRWQLATLQVGIYMSSYCIDDIDECAVLNCDPNATCTNTAGSFACTCNQGYTGDGSVCTGKLPVTGL